MTFRLGVDIGGTFTDFCLIDEDSLEVTSFKLLSTPNNPGAEIVAGLAHLACDPNQLRYFVHGTTVGVNTVIQKSGARTGLITTRGFEDVLELARLKMPDPYDIFSNRPPPLVPREHVYGIDERISADGEILTAIDESSVRDVIARLQSDGVEIVVIALLHAYRNPTHEQALQQTFEKHAPEIAVVLASDVWPVIREYERTATAVLAAYVQPKVAAYLASLEARLAESGVDANPMITKSNGGVMSTDSAKQRAAEVLLSGTASGVMGAAYVAQQSGWAKALSFDVGGTSADVAFIDNAEVAYSTGEVVGEYPLYIPSVSVTSVGEGGGSIAWLDPLGVLKVGPRSAGSEPGPAGYARGGTEPTVTDAFATLGFLGDALGFGAVTLDRDAARRAIDPIAQRLGLCAEATAEAIIDVATANIYTQIAKLMARQGISPEDRALIAFGGAGPMMAAWIAKELSLNTVVVPRTPGVLSAFGGLIADMRSDFIFTAYYDVQSSTQGAIAERFQALARLGEQWLRTEQRHPGPMRTLYSGDMRYRGQSFETPVEFEPGWALNGDVDAIRSAFHNAHERIYGHADADADVQLINLRAVAVGDVAKPETPVLEATATPATPVGVTNVFFRGNWHEAPVFDRDSLAPGHVIEGPAIVRQSDCTTCLIDAFRGHVDPMGNLIIERQP
ncbi:MAG: hydantoinase/oxoprolinase family protein [Pseudomonadota bacterium]